MLVSKLFIKNYLEIDEKFHSQRVEGGDGHVELVDELAKVGEQDGLDEDLVGPSPNRHLKSGHGNDGQQGARDFLDRVRTDVPQTEGKEHKRRVQGQCGEPRLKSGDQLQKQKGD